MSGLEALVALVLLEPLIKDGIRMYRFRWKRRKQRKLRDKRTQMKLLKSYDTAFYEVEREERNGRINKEEKIMVENSPGFKHIRERLEAIVGVLKKVKWAKPTKQNDQIVAKTMMAMMDLLNRQRPAKKAVGQTARRVTIAREQKHPLVYSSAYCGVATRLRATTEPSINEIAVWRPKDGCYTCNTCHLDIGAFKDGAHWKKSEWLMLAQSHIPASSAFDRSVWYQCYLCQDFGLTVKAELASDYLFHLYVRHAEEMKYIAHPGSRPKRQDGDALASDDDVPQSRLRYESIKTKSHGETSSQADGDELSHDPQVPSKKPSKSHNGGKSRRRHEEHADSSKPKHKSGRLDEKRSAKVSGGAKLTVAADTAGDSVDNSPLVDNGLPAGGDPPVDAPSGDLEDLPDEAPLLSENDLTDEDTDDFGQLEMEDNDQATLFVSGDEDNVADSDEDEWERPQEY